MEGLDLERMRKWRENTAPVLSAEFIRSRSQSNSGPKQMGCGGDMKDGRDQDAWNREFNNNPIYRGYR